MSEIGKDDQPQQTFIVERTKGPGCLVQSLWFIFIGWWLGALVISLAWFLNVIIIGLPLGMKLLNNIPKVLALQDPQKRFRVITIKGKPILDETDQPQHNFLLRVIFFLLIGWWWSGIWLASAYILSLTIILLPIGLWMFRLTPMMTTLRRY
jgi:uncharacterized membrane protein YccF (DUF307 family)